jgi:hypothetical protein
MLGSIVTDFDGVNPQTAAESLSATKEHLPVFAQLVAPRFVSPVIQATKICRAKNINSQHYHQIESG